MDQDHWIEGFTTVVPILVALQDEGVDVWRPVHVERRANGLYRIVTGDPDATIEEWEFPSGSVVRCEQRSFDGEAHLVAVALAAGSHLMSQEEDLTKIVVDLPHHWATGGESMWARQVGEDLYEVRNVPFYAYGLNFGDVIRAIEPAPDKKPVVLELVTASGHETLRVRFTDAVAEADRPELLRELHRHQAYFEGANCSYFAIDVEPEGDYAAVRAQLDEWDADGLLEYETCEARVPGSFDDRPDNG